MKGFFVVSQEKSRRPPGRRDDDLRASKGEGEREKLHSSGFYGTMMPQKATLRFFTAGGS